MIGKWDWPHILTSTLQVLMVITKPAETIHPRKMVSIIYAYFIINNSITKLIFYIISQSNAGIVPLTSLEGIANPTSRAYAEYLYFKLGFTLLKLTVTKRASIASMPPWTLFELLRNTLCAPLVAVRVMEHPLILFDLQAKLHMNRSDVCPTLFQCTLYNLLATVII